MKKVTKYEANDGTLFNDEASCISYDNRKAVIERMENELYLREMDTEELYDWIMNNKNLFK